MDAFRLAVAKIISEAWGEPENVAKIFDGVDTGALIATLRRAELTVDRKEGR